MRTIMERAFWDTIAEGLSQSPPQYERVVGLVAEVRQELEALSPEGWKAELRECMDLELLAQVYLPLLASVLPCMLSVLH